MSYFTHCLAHYGCRAALCLALCAASTAAGSVAVAAEQQNAPMVVTLGADLDPDQQQSMLRILNVEPGAGVRVLTVTNAEERALLGNDVPAELIGSKAISSASVNLAKTGSGLTIERYNITFVTPAMYGNALATAGVRDAHVVVAAPMAVSGTAALTGILKAFENASGKELAPEAKQTAGDELVTTGQLAKEVGNAKATELLARVKEKVAGENLKDEGAVRRVVVDVAGDLNINLTTEQVDQVTDIAVRVSRLNLQADDLRRQLAGLRETITDLAESPKAKSWLQQLLDLIAGLFNRIFGGIASWLGQALGR